MRKLNSKFKRCIFIRYRTDEYGYRFWDPENHKILRSKDLVFNEQKPNKDLQTERSTSENDLGVAPRSSSEQQSAADTEFIELEDSPVDKTRNIPEGNMESRVAPLTPQFEFR